jgi:hypothetical protein
VPSLPTTATARVFVNNADDKNEECMEILLTYTSANAHSNTDTIKTL